MNTIGYKIKKSILYLILILLGLIQTIKMYGDGTALFCRHQHIDSIFTVHFQIAQFADKRRQPANVSQQETGKIKLVTQIPENPSAHVATSRVYPPVISPRTPARKIPSD